MGAWRSLSPAKLRRVIVDLANDEDGSSMGADVKGDAYEGLLEKNAHGTKSGAGQYFKQRAQQLVWRTGGPPFETHLSTPALLREAFAGMQISELREYEAKVAEVHSQPRPIRP